MTRTEFTLFTIFLIYMKRILCTPSIRCRIVRIYTRRFCPRISANCRSLLIFGFSMYSLMRSPGSTGVTQGELPGSSQVAHRLCSTHGRSRRRRKGRKEGRIIQVSPDLVWAPFDALAAICRGLNGGVPHFGTPRLSLFLCCW